MNLKLQTLLIQQDKNIESLAETVKKYKAYNDKLEGKQNDQARSELPSHPNSSHR